MSLLKSKFHGLLEPVLLKVIADKPLHGYSLILYLRNNFGVNYGTSTVYPALKKLEMQGFVVACWDVSKRPVKLYAITPAGAEALKVFLQEFSTLSHKLGVE